MSRIFMGIYMKVYRLFFLFLLLLPLLSSQAQTIHIYGQTREHFTYDPIPNVYIWVMDKDSTILVSGMSSENEGLQFQQP